MCDLAVDDQLCLIGYDRIPLDIDCTVDGENTRTQRPLGVRDRVAADPTTPCGALSKTGQRSVRVRKLQAKEARWIDSSCGVSRGRVPSERQNRAVRQVLLDLVGKCPVKLPQHDADVRIGVAR